MVSDTDPLLSFCSIWSYIFCYRWSCCSAIESDDPFGLPLCLWNYRLPRQFYCSLWCTLIKHSIQLSHFLVQLKLSSASTGSACQLTLYTCFMNSYGYLQVINFQHSTCPTNYRFHFLGFLGAKVRL